MSLPWQRLEDSARSPLDRQPPNPFPAGQPASFKTNVNRMKTKRWVEAKSYTYDGDDWGDYDEYDEYGAHGQPPAPLKPTGLRQAGQSTAEPSRSFTEPYAQSKLPHPPRKNSFDAGDDRRAFPASMPMGGPPGVDADPAETPQQGTRAMAPAGLPPLQTDMSQTDAAPSLQTRISPVPQAATGSPFPPRKSSVNSQSPTVAGPPGPASPSQQRSPTSPSKPLPFIRPADIYKRMAEEREKERQSLESGRPSMDSIMNREETSPVKGPGERGSSDSLRRGSFDHAEASDSRRLKPMLDTVAERKSEYAPEYSVTSGDQSNRGDTGRTAGSELTSSTDASKAPESQRGDFPGLPPVHRISTFGDDLWPSQPAELESAAGAASAGGDDGLKSVVDQAFYRREDDRSIPPTPISKDSQAGSGVSRSNTDSTAGISPIMSRVPSSAAAAAAARMKTAEARDMATPAIAEEANEASPPTSRPNSRTLQGPQQVARKPSPSYLRNAPAGSHGGSQSPSPARSPDVRSSTPASLPESGEFTASPVVGEPATDYTTREHDLATALQSNSDPNVEALVDAEKRTRTSFLESRQNASAATFEPTPPQPSSPSGSRPVSPSKGRVRDLAGKFNDIDSRRNSAASIGSRASVSSWERSREPSPVKGARKSRDVSPVKQDPERPAADRNLSFRPKLPGQWESYITTPGVVEGPTGNVSTPEPEQVESQGGGQAPIGESKPLEEVDFAPTTQRRSLVSAGESNDPSGVDPLAALKAVGAAMGEALKASVGVGKPDEGSEHPTPDKEEPSTDGPEITASIGDVYLRPLKVDRSAPSFTSSVTSAPAPEEPSSSLPTEAAPGLREADPAKPITMPQFSTDSPTTDDESERLRKEIVASLTPMMHTESPELAAPTDQPASAVPDGAQRQSSVLPAEYETYWAGADESIIPQALTSRSPSADAEASPNVQATILSRMSPTPLGDANSSSDSNVGPGLLNKRFSWEAGAAPSSTKAVVEKESSNLPTSPDSSKVPFSTDEGTAKHHDGLYIVNSAEGFEAVDLPPRLLADEAQQSQPTPPPDQGTRQDVVSSPSPAVLPAPATDRPQPPYFREILAMKSAQHRIATYNRTREYFATENTGLAAWIGATLATKPDLAESAALSLQAQPPPSTTTTTTASVRHKVVPSISKFGRHGPSFSSSPSTPYYQQYLDSAQQIPARPATPTSTTATMMAGQPQHASGLTLGGGGSGRLTSQQMQAKGKDLLHSAGVLGGKATIGAKGLLAKGRSKFKGGGGGSDKVDH